MLSRASAWVNARPPRTLRRLVFGAVLLFILGLNTHGHHGGSGDEPHYQMIAHSLVFDRDLDLGNNYDDPTNLVGSGTLEPESHALPGRGGRLRPVHDIGLPLLSAPAFAAAYVVAEHASEWVSPRLMARARLTEPLVLRHLLSVAMATVTACLAVVLFGICRSMSPTASPAFFWTLLFTLSPPLLSHSFLFFTEIPAALIVVLFWYAFTSSGPSSRTTLALIGAAAGFLLLLHIRNVGLVAGMAALIVWRGRRSGEGPGRAWWFLVPILAWAAVRTGVNVHLWGTMITTPHAAPAAVSSLPAFGSEVGTRLFGLLVDQEHGLLPYAPIYLLVLPGWLLMRRLDPQQWRALSVLIASYVLPILLPFVNRHGWDGGWSPAARFLVPIAPLLLLAGYRYFALPGRRRLPSAVVILVIVQVALNLLFWSHPKLLWNDGIGASALARYLSAGPVDLPSWLPSWHAPSGYTTLVSVLLLTSWAALSMRAARRVDVSRRTFLN